MAEALQEQEQYFQCPYCWETISMVLDPSAGEQSYVEDCEVCCRPIRVTYSVSDDGEINGILAATLDE